MGYCFTDLSQHIERGVVMTHQKEAQFQITEGPSKFDLMIALFKKDEAVRFSVTPDPLTGTKSPVILTVQINGITVEDGSHESWLMQGMWKLSWDLNLLNWTNFHGYYDSRTRKGWLKNTLFAE